MITQKNAEDFVKGVFTEVWCERNKDAVKKYYHPEFIGILHGEEEFKFEDVLKRVEYSKNNFENTEAIFHDVFPALDNRIVARVTMHSVDKKTKEQRELHFMVVTEMKDGKMYRQWTFANKFYRYKDWE